MHVHTCIHAKTHNHTTHGASPHQPKKPLQIQFIVGWELLGAGDDGIFVGSVPRTTLKKSSSHVLHAAISQGYKCISWPSRKPKYKGHHERPGVIHAKNDLPWAPHTAHLFSKSLLCPYCITDPVLGDGNRGQNRPKPCPNEAWLDKKRKEKKAKTVSLLSLQILFIIDSHSIKPPPKDQRFKNHQ